MTLGDEPFLICVHSKEEQRCRLFAHSTSKHWVNKLLILKRENAVSITMPRISLAYKQQTLISHAALYRSSRILLNWTVLIWVRSCRLGPHLVHVSLILCWQKSVAQVQMHRLMSRLCYVTHLKSQLATQVTWPGPTSAEWKNMLPWRSRRGSEFLPNNSPVYQSVILLNEQKIRIPLPRFHCHSFS